MKRKGIKQIINFRIVPLCIGGKGIWIHFLLAIYFFKILPFIYVWIRICTSTYLYPCVCVILCIYKSSMCIGLSVNMCICFLNICISSFLTLCFTVCCMSALLSVYMTNFLCVYVCMSASMYVCLFPIKISSRRLNMLPWLKGLRRQRLVN